MLFREITYLFAVCERYSEAVTQEEDSPVLTPGAEKNEVSTCGIVEVPLVVGGMKAAPREFPHMVCKDFLPYRVLNRHTTFMQYVRKHSVVNMLYLNLKQTITNLNKITHAIHMHENCIRRRFIICPFYQILLGSSNKRELDERCT